MFQESFKTSHLTQFKLWENVRGEACILIAAYVDRGMRGGTDKKGGGPWKGEDKAETL